MSNNPFIINNRNGTTSTSTTSYRIGSKGSNFAIKTTCFGSPDRMFNGEEDNFSPPRTNFGSINYSPKHSRKPSSLMNNRNMKKLSLNLVNDDNNENEAEADEGQQLRQQQLFNKPSITRRKTLTLSIPSNESFVNIKDLPLVTPSVTTTPSLPPMLLKNKSYTIADISNHTTNRDISFKMSDINEIKPPSGVDPYLSLHVNDCGELKSPLILNSKEESLISKFSKFSIHEPKKFPEELQESSQLNAYPNGPANVLNNSIYLYSDPNMGSMKVDINNFDLVINVAKECINLSSSFNNKNGEKEYLYIPWSHTSSISNELPNLTEKIKKYDDSNKTTKKKRKVLVHCQCGVSRSACVIVAYFMLKFKIGVNEAYELLKTGTNNLSEPTNQLIKSKGYTIDACERICPNMSLIFELMEFGDKLNNDNNNSK